MWEKIAALVCLVALTAGSSILTYMIYKAKADAAKQKLIQKTVELLKEFVAFEKEYNELREQNEQLQQLVSLQGRVMQNQTQELEQKDLLVQVLKMKIEFLERTLDKLKENMLGRVGDPPKKPDSN